MRMPSLAQRQSLESRIAAAEENLSPAGLRYLTERGIEEGTAKKFRLGLDAPTGRLAIPYLTPVGPWSIKLRCIEHEDCKPIHNDKYIYSESGTESHLFNSATLRTAERVLLTEGELDAITAEQYGINAVSYPGATNWQKHWRWCFDSVSEIAVVADGDEPGRKAATSVADSLRSAVSADVKVVRLPDGFDTNSFINAYGDFELLLELDWL